MCGRPTLLFALCGSALVASAGRSANAQSQAQGGPAAQIVQGRAAYERADFDASRRAFEAAERAPDVNAADRLEAHRYLATLDLARGDRAAARRHAAAAVAIDLAVAAPDGASAELSALLDQERTRLRQSRAWVGAGDGPSSSTASTASTRRGVGAGWIVFGVSGGVLVAGAITTAIVVAASSASTPGTYRFTSIALDPATR